MNYKISIPIILFALAIEAPLNKKDQEVYFVSKIHDPPNLQMFFSIEKYAKEFNIPKSFLYGIAYHETRYEGPYDLNYKHNLSSPVGALGPMQIMPATSRFINGETVSRERLKSDIDYNVKTSAKLLRYLKDRYGDWKIVFGFYNTGKPKINSYAMKVYHFKVNWNYVTP